MAIDIVIKQTGLFKKTLPLDIITGNNLAYGNHGDDGIRLVDELIDDGYFIVYDPQKLGRGITVEWNEKEKNKIVLRQLIPTHREVLKACFDIVKRITDYWKCDLEVDGTNIKPQDFLSQYDDYLEFNKDTAMSQNEKITSDDPEYEKTTLPCVLFPLVLGKEEARSFQNNIENFYDWMHEKQSIDAYYGVPKFYQVEDKIIGMYVVTEDTTSIFPTTPDNQIGLINVINQNNIKYDEISITLYSMTEDGSLGMIPYHHFLQAVKDKSKPFDGDHILIEGLSYNEMKEIIESIHNS